MNNEIEYVEEGHVYLYKGLYIVPSVTQILEKIFPDKYKNVPRETLMRKASYGSQIHQYIEQYEKGIITIKLNYIQEASFGQYLRLKDKYNINVLEQEKIVNYKDIYAGRYDMLAEINGEIWLIDIKTTASLDKEYLSWQLSLYEYAEKLNADHLGSIWLPKKDIGRLVEIERKSKKEINKLLEEVKKWK